MAVYQVKVVGKIVGRESVNIFYYEGEITDMQAFADDLGAVYNTTIIPQLAQQAEFDKVTIKQLAPVQTPEQEFVPAGWPTQGGVFAETSAGLLAGLVSFKGANPVYPVNSRKYVWGISEERISQNQLTPEMVSALQAFGDAIVGFSTSAATGSFVCYRRSDGSTNPYGTAFARSLVATQRRRSGL